MAWEEMPPCERDTVQSPSESDDTGGAWKGFELAAPVKMFQGERKQEKEEDIARKWVREEKGRKEKTAEVQGRAHDSPLP